MEWQPIETAPKDEVWVLGYSPNMPISEYPYVMYYEENTYGNPKAWTSISNRGYGQEEIYPTHWMPLPPAPTVIK